MRTGKHQILTTFTFLFLTIFGNIPSTFAKYLIENPVILTDDSEVVDGPHVFYESNKIVVRNFHLTDATCSIEEEVFHPLDPVTLHCKLDVQGNVAFTIPLRKTHEAPPSEYEEPSKLFAISDIEGNFQAFAATLQGNNVIDQHFSWTYGTGHLVLVGDFFDRGDHVTACLWLIYKLEQEARDAGGMVHFINGNHEEMNLRGVTRYVRSKYKRVAKALNMDCKDLYGKNTELGRWLRTRNIIERIGSTLFVHGGISPQIAQSNLTIHKINAIAKANIGDTKPTLEMTEKGESKDLIMAKIGPMWYRGYFDNNGLGQDAVEAGLQKFGAERVVVGHTIVPEVTSLLGGRVIAIDVKHAANIKAGLSNALLIENGILFRVNAFGNQENLGIITEEAKEETDVIASVFKAVAEGDIRALDIFLNEGNDINGRYTGKQYPILHFAIEKRQVRVVKYLVNKGADPNILYDDKTPLMLAIKKGHRGIIAFLIHTSPDIEFKNLRMKTALYYAAKYGDPPIAKMLIERGARLDHKDYKGRTPFQYAANNRNDDVARYLKSLEN